MLTKNIRFKNFLIKSNNVKINKIKNIFYNIKKEYYLGDLKLLFSFSKNYKYSFTQNFLNKFNKFKNYNIIGMGGSILGAETIYDFLNYKIKKKFLFIDNLKKKINIKKEKSLVNIIISKSGNTLETICNSNIVIKNNKKNIFIIENNNNYLRNLAHKIKAEIVEHKNYIGGRYSVLSEAGMLPAQLMGLEEKKFKRLNYLIQNKIFINQLIRNVWCTLNLVKKGKYLSIILNYDFMSENLFKWYQQLLSESLGKKSKGIMPIISNMPKDNHSLMQFYLDGPKKNFFTFFNVFEKNSNKINKELLLNSHNYLRNKNIQKIVSSQILSTQKVFKNKKIPYRSFEILNRNEQTLGEIFCFFILETIMLGRALNVNPFDQPSVELIKKESKKILIKS